jgi:hypothetical protein
MEKSSHQTRLLAKKNEKNCKKLVKIARNLQEICKNCTKLVRFGP